MPHRLPLSSPARDAHWEGPRVPLAWPAIGIADTDRGLDAARFALEFAEAAGSVARVVLLDFAVAPQLPSELAQRFPTLVSCRFGEHPSVEEGALELWVGTPAVVAFAPRLAILLGTQRPPLQWPTVLRGATVQLALPAPRAGLARALVEELSGRGFLPAKAHSVR